MASTITFKNEIEKLKKELTNLEMGEIRKLVDGGYQMDVKYGENDWEELDMVRRPTHVTPFEVHGGIAKVWRGEGGTRGRLGYPVSNEEQLPLDCPNAVEGDRVSYFEHGRMIWHKNDNGIEVSYN